MNTAIVSDPPLRNPSDDVFRAFGMAPPRRRRVAELVRGPHGVIRVPIETPEETEQRLAEARQPVKQRIEWHDLRAQESRERAEAEEAAQQPLMALEDYLAAPGAMVTLVDPHKGDGKSPLRCLEHRSCRLWAWEHCSVSDDPAVVRSVTAWHPDALIGFVPTGKTLVIDFDTREALVDLLFATDVSLDDHCVGVSPKGWHLFCQAPADLTEGSLRAPAGIDLRYSRESIANYVIAPEQTRRDGGEYRITHGTWGEFLEAEESLMDYLGWNPNPEGQGTYPQPPCAVESKPKDLDDRVARFLDRCERLAQLHAEEEDSGKGTEKGRYRTTSASLMGAWRSAQWAGLTVEQAVDVVITYQPSIAEKAWAGVRSRSWALQDAQRVYKRPMLGDADRLAYSGAPGASAVAANTQRQGRLPQVWDYVVALVNKHQRTEHIGLGVQELATTFGVSKMAASKWLRKLEKLGLLVRAREAVYRYDGHREHNRVREWHIRGIEVEHGVAVVMELTTPAARQEMQCAA